MTMHGNIKQARLDHAIAERCKMEAVVQAARKAAERAGQLLSKAQDWEAEFTDLDTEIAEHNAEAIKQGTKNLELPAALQARQADREKARRQIEEAEAARQLLLDELKEKEATLAEAKMRVGECAAVILVGEATQLGSDLEIAWATVWQLYDELGGLASVWAPQSGKTRPLALPPNAFALMQLIAGFDSRQFAGGRNEARAAASAKWRAKYNRLIEG